MDWDALLPQTLVYWPPGPPGATDRRGYGAPVQLGPGDGLGGGRWEDKVQVVKDAGGEDRTSSATAWTRRLRPLPKGRLAVAALAGLPADQLANPRTVPGSWDVIASGSTPSLDGTDVLYQCWM